MADFKKRLEQWLKNAKMYYRGFRASFDIFGKHVLLFVALRVAFALFFRAGSKKK